VRAQREAAFILRTAPTPSLPSGLLDRLAGLPMSTSLPPPAGGLPIVIGPDGAPLIVAGPLATDRSGPSQAHDRLGGRRAQPGGHDPQLGGVAQHQLDVPQELHAHQPASVAPAVGVASRAHPRRRKTLLPIGLVASAAAVVAAGTLGGQLSSNSATINQPMSVVKIAGHNASGADDTGDGAGQDVGSQSPAESTPRPVVATSDPSAPTRGDQSSPALEDFPLGEQLTPSWPLTGVNRHTGRP